MSRYVPLKPKRHTLLSNCGTLFIGCALALFFMHIVLEDPGMRDLQTVSYPFFLFGGILLTIGMRIKKRSKRL